MRLSINNKKKKEGRVRTNERRKEKKTRRKPFIPQ